MNIYISKKICLYDFQESQIFKWIFNLVQKRCKFLWGPSLEGPKFKIGYNGETFLSVPSFIVCIVLPHHIAVKIPFFYIQTQLLPAAWLNIVKSYKTPSLISKLTCIKYNLIICQVIWLLLSLSIKQLIWQVHCK